MQYFTIECCSFLDTLVKAFQSVLTDEDFDFPSQPAIAAKKGAEQVLAWHAISTNQAEMAVFADQLQFTLQACFKDIKKMKDRKERMYEQLYQLRSTDEFGNNWEMFLRKCGVEDNPISAYYKVFTYLITVNFPKSTEPSQVTIPQLDYNKRNALRYVAGYVTRTIY